jgi:hypothetical protein
VPSVDSLTTAQVREALRLMGVGEVPSQRPAALRILRDRLRSLGAVRDIVDRAPEEARVAFVRLATEGPAAVPDLLGRGWWGRGLLPPPLDWLQLRGLVVAGEDGLVHATEEAREGFAELRLDLPAGSTVSEHVRVDAARCVVVTTKAALLDRVLAVPAAALRGIAPTVAVSNKSPASVAAALRAAGVRLDDDVAVSAQPEAPALAAVAEDAVGPRAIRALLDRAVAERRQVHLDYFASSRGGAATQRVVDPWSFADDLLRGYCHLRSGERTFAVDRIGRARLLPTALDHSAP